MRKLNQILAIGALATSVLTSGCLTRQSCSYTDKSCVPVKCIDGKYYNAQGKELVYPRGFGPENQFEFKEDPYLERDKDKPIRRVYKHY